VFGAPHRGRNILAKDRALIIIIQLPAAPGPPVLMIDVTPNKN
jgi:hypothetical protein